ncbi:MAG: exosortase/archaeosortase family protein [Pseudomonadota bacterium]|nr:exosortase/archaeosortase family protein [Pseudomonadota bacterium]
MSSQLLHRLRTDALVIKERYGHAAWGRMQMWRNAILARLGQLACHPRILPLRPLRENLLGWLESSAGIAAQRYLSIGSQSLAAVLTLFILNAFQGGWTWMQHVRDGLARHILQLPAEFVPIPFAFLLWVRLMERERPFVLRFSPFFGALGIACLAAIPQLLAFPDLRQYLFGAAVVSSLFVLVSFADCLGRMIRQPRPAIVAILAASAACNYYWLMRTLWAQMIGWTAHTVHVILRFYGAAAFAMPHPKWQGSFIIGSHYFRASVNPGCNGLEGIFLFNFLLSVMLLLDWQLFRRRSLILLYGLGVIYMFFVNAIRITVLFSIGYWAYRPDAWPFMWHFRGATLEMFHSYEGWVFYLIAFGLFAAWLYRTTLRRNQLTVNG